MTNQWLEHTLVKSLMPTEFDVNSCTVHAFRAATFAMSSRRQRSKRNWTPLRWSHKRRYGDAHGHQRGGVAMEHIATET